LAEKFFRVLMIDLLEYRVGQREFADFKPPLAWPGAAQALITM